MADGDSGGGEDGVVIAPGWVAHIEGGRLELGKEVADDAESASTGQGLHRCNSVVADPWAVEAEEDTLGALVELCKTVDGQILFVEGVICDDGSFGLAHDGEDEWLAIVVAVGTDAQVDLLGVLVVLEARCEGEDGISWRLLHVRELIVQGGETLHFVDEIFIFILYWNQR